MIFWGSLKNGCVWLLSPFHRSRKSVSLGQAWRKPRKHTNELVGDYSDADRRLWLAVNVGFTSLVEIALAKGGDASRTFQMKNDLGATVTVDLLLLCWMKTVENQAFLRSPLASAGLRMCDPISRWGISPDGEFGASDQEEQWSSSQKMDGNDVARRLILAGASPYRAFNDIRGTGGDRTGNLESSPRWVAAEHVRE